MRKMFRNFVALKSYNKLQKYDNNTMLNSIKSVSLKNVEYECRPCTIKGQYFRHTSYFASVICRHHTIPRSKVSKEIESTNHTLVRVYTQYVQKLFLSILFFARHYGAICYFVGYCISGKLIF